MAPITFSNIPNTIRTPFVGVEFDPSRSRQGPAQKPYKVLQVGLRRSTGTVAAGVLKQLTGSDQAATWFGLGSQLHAMARAHFQQGQLVETWAIAFDENASGHAQTKTLTVTGPATAAGVLYLYVLGRRIKVSVASGDTAANIAIAINAAVNAVTDLGVTSTVATVVATLAYVHKGACGASIDVRFNFAQGEEFPTGVTVAVAGGTAGDLDPAITGLWPLIGDTQYDIIEFGFYDPTTITADFDVELEDRWGPVRRNDGTAILGYRGTQSSASTVGSTKNSKHVVVMPADNSPTPPWEWAAMVGGVAARELQADPARPLQTLPLVGAVAPTDLDRYTLAEQNLLLYDGMSTFTVDQAGVVHLGRVVTLYQVNNTGQPDASFLDVTSTKTLSLLRYEVEQTFASKYPRHKLGQDGVNYGAGQAIMTPALARAEMITLFRSWESRGLVEGFEQFKTDLVCERDPVDPNRLNILMGPDLMNSLVVVGVKAAFLL